jgi:hemoglobin
MYEFAGGIPAFLALAAANHQRCLADPELNHPFSHGGRPDHLERLAGYWAEVFGGPPRYTEEWGGHSAMLDVEWAVAEVLAYSPHGSTVPAGLRVPRWGWNGPEPS